MWGWASTRGSLEGEAGAAEAEFEFDGDMEEPEEEGRQPILALLFIAPAPSVSRTPKSRTPPPRAGHVRELCPLLLQCEHRLVISLAGASSLSLSLSVGSGVRPRLRRLAIKARPPLKTKPPTHLLLNHGTLPMQKPWKNGHRPFALIISTVHPTARAMAVAAPATQHTVPPSSFRQVEPHVEAHSLTFLFPRRRLTRAPRHPSAPPRKRIGWSSGWVGR